MSENVLLDSVILIDHLNGVDAATEYLIEVAPRASISAITRAEVLTGYAPGEAESVRQLLDRFRFLPVDRSVADLSAELRREFRWRLPDALQAATARVHGLRLVTRNTRDFPPDRHGFVRVPYAV